MGLSKFYQAGEKIDPGQWVRVNKEDGKLYLAHIIDPDLSAISCKYATKDDFISGKLFSKVLKKRKGKK